MYLYLMIIVHNLEKKLSIKFVKLNVILIYLGLVRILVSNVLIRYLNLQQ